MDKKFSIFLLKSSAYILLFGVLIYGLLFFTGNLHLLKAINSTYLSGTTGPSIYDSQKFIYRTLEKDSKPFNFPKSQESIILTKNETDSIGFWETKSLVIIKNDSILFEKYFRGSSRESRSNSFSVAKSLVSIGIGIALKNGYLNSLDDKIGAYIPELKGKAKGDISVRNLLEMSSGVDFGESYGDPFGFMAKAYYGKELFDLTISKPQQQKPGEIWKYQGGNTLLLSFIIKNTSGENLSSFFEKEVWTKIGSEYSAEWIISDKDSLERAYCCFYSTAIDLAKIGRLYLNYGNWNGHQIIDSTYVVESMRPQDIYDENGNLIDYYGLHWWLSEFKGEPFFYARGILGQYVVVFPKQDLILVRQGHKRDQTKGVEVPKDLYLYLKIAAKAFD